MSVRSVVRSVSATLALSLGGTLGSVSAHDSSLSLVGEVDLSVESVEFVEGQATANVVVSFDLLGKPVEQELSVPIEIGAVPGDDVTPDSLTVSLEAVESDLCGLVVEFDDGEGGPVVVGITPTSDTEDPSALVGQIATALVDGVDLETILAGLSEEDVVLLATTLADVLDETLAAVIEEGSNDDGNDDDCDLSAAKSHVGKGVGKGKSKGQGRGKGKGRGGDDDEDDDEDDDDDSDSGSRRIELVEFESDGVAFATEDGLLVETSAVRLEISAEGGKGNLLGNMIRQLEHLQSRPGNTGKAQKAIMKNLLRALDRIQMPAL